MLPDKFKVNFNPATVRKKKLEQFVQTTQLLERLARLRKKDNDIFLKVGSILKGSPTIAELRKVVASFKKKKLTPEEEDSFLYDLTKKRGGGVITSGDYVVDPRSTGLRLRDGKAGSGGRKGKKRKQQPNEEDAEAEQPDEEEEEAEQADEAEEEVQREQEVEAEEEVQREQEEENIAILPRKEKKQKKKDPPLSAGGRGLPEERLPIQRGVSRQGDRNNLFLVEPENECDCKPNKKIWPSLWKQGEKYFSRISVSGM